MSKFYAVRVGLVPGVYNDWASCKQQIDGQKGAIHKSFKTREEAEAFVQSKEPLRKTVKKKPSTVPMLVQEEETELGNVIYCDGGHNKDTGKVAYACVVDGLGQDLLAKYQDLFETKEVDLACGHRHVLVADFTDVTSQQNNGAELLAMHAALKIAIQNKEYTIIRSDSQLVVSHWSQKLNPKKIKEMDPHKVTLIKETIALRKTFVANGGTIQKIPGKNNLADLGYHK